jgi:hypothetical protein
MIEQANDSDVRITLILPRPLFDGLLELGKRYKTGVHGVIRHLAHNAVDNARHMQSVVGRANSRPTKLKG